MKCECEHKRHFSEGTADFEKAVHFYGTPYRVTIPVKTPYGTFRVCQHCVETCYASFVEKK